MPTPWAEMTPEQKERHRATYRRYYARHREERLAQVKSYYRKHRKERVAYSLAYARQHAKKVKRYMRAYRRSEHGKLLTAYHNRTANYGLRRPELDAMLESQKGLCLICARQLSVQGKDGLAVDHDHKTLKIRGLLCGFCNRGLGMFFHSPDRLQAAARYLQNY